MTPLTPEQAHELLDAHGAWYRPAGIPVRVTRVTERFEWVAETGSVLVAEPGDYRIDDGTHHWSVKPEIFKANYQRIDENSWRTTGRTRLMVLDTELIVESLEGPSAGTVGDLLAGGAGGDVWIMPASRLERYVKEA